MDENGNPVKYANIISQKLKKGSESDPNGIFSIISMPGDTIIFRAIGFKTSYLPVPLTVTTGHYIADVYIQIDTINIADVVILPWRTYEEFKQAVLDYKPETNDLDNLAANMAVITRHVYQGFSSSPEVAYRNAMQSNINSLMVRNQLPPNNLLNPFAWSRFIDGLKNGLLRNDAKGDKNKKKAKPAKVREKR